MRKFTLIIGIALMVFSACQNQEKNPQYTISGRVIDATESVVYLARLKGNDAEYLDSTTMKNGKFELTGSVDIPENLYVVIGDDDNYFSIFMSNDIINVLADVDSLNKAEIEGAPYQTELENFNRSLEPIIAQKEELYKKYKEASENDDSETMDIIDTKWEELDAEEKNTMIQYVKTNTNSPIGPFLIRQKTYLFELNELEDVDNVYDKSLDNSPYVIYLRDRIAGLKKVAVGKNYSELTMLDTSSNTTNISDYEGKYLLIDFWASWCGPCRLENPNLVKAYNKYRNENFEIIGVSFDSNADRWKKAIVDDNLEWIQMSDLKGWECAAKYVYMINSIPSNVLIDPNGVIIAKNLRGVELQNKLTELFGE